MNHSQGIFPLGRIVSTDDVVDRHSFIKETKIRLVQGSSVMLSGPRRIGKSSVAYEILRQLKDEDCYVAHVDLFFVTSVEELAAKLIQSILENRTGVWQKAATAMKHLKDVFQKSDIHAKMNDLEISITLEAQHDSDALLETAFSMAEILAKKDNKRIMILLDEFQELDRLGSPELLKRLRSIFQQQKQTSYFFLGSESSVLNTIFADRRQAFYRFATLTELPVIPKEEWQKYIVEKLNRVGVAITERAIDLLLDRTGSHPYCVMSIMVNAYVSCVMNKFTEIDAETLLFAYEQSMTQLDAVYTKQWEEIRRFKGVSAVLTSILYDDAIYKKENTNITRAIQNLMRLSVIKKGSNRGKYLLIEPMFGDWLKEKVIRNEVD